MHIDFVAMIRWVVCVIVLVALGAATEEFIGEFVEIYNLGKLSSFNSSQEVSSEVSKKLQNLF